MRVRDIEVMIGLLAVLEGHLLGRDVSPELTSTLIARFTRAGLLRPGADGEAPSAGQLARALEAMIQRLRVGLGEYDAEPATSSTLTAHVLAFPAEADAHRCKEALAEEAVVAFLESRGGDGWEHHLPMGCVFCHLIASDSAQWVAKQEQAVAFLPLPESAIAPGHTLVVPRGHTADSVIDLPPDQLALTMHLVQRVSQAMLSQPGASGVCVLNASGANSGRSVDHPHFHVVPRYPEDGEECLPWPAGRSAHVLDGDPRALLSSAF